MRIVLLLCEEIKLIDAFSANIVYLFTCKILIWLKTIFKNTNIIEIDGANPTVNNV